MRGVDPERRYEKCADAELRDAVGWVSVCDDDADNISNEIGL